MSLFKRKILTNSELKQVILIRTDLKLPKGKAAAQVAHASVESVLKSDSSIVNSWRSQGMKKIVLKVQNEKELLQYKQAAKRAGLVASVITDAGKTVVTPRTRTCLGIGPAPEEQIDSITRELGMF